MKKRPLILFGGGLDSCALVEMYSSLNPVLLHFSYGQRALEGEIGALKYFSEKYQLESYALDIPTLLIPPSPLTSEATIKDKEQHAGNYIPGRNLLFSALAYSFAASRSLTPIMLGASPAPADSAFWDAKLGFGIKFNILTAYAYPSDSAPELMLPLVTGSRGEYLREALRTEPLLFDLSYTCYEGSHGYECGECVHCQQKAALAKTLGVTMRKPTLRQLRMEK